MNYRLKTIEKFHKLSIEEILAKTSQFTGVEVKYLKGRSRLRRYSDAKHLARYYAYACGYTTKEIGMGMRSHRTNTYHSIKNVFNWSETDEQFNRRLEEYVDFMR